MSQTRRHLAAKIATKTEFYWYSCMISSEKKNPSSLEKYSDDSLVRHCATCKVSVGIYLLCIKLFDQGVVEDIFLRLPRAMPEKYKNAILYDWLENVYIF